MEPNRFIRQGAARCAMRGIGRASQHSRGADLAHRRPGSFAPWRCCVSRPMPRIDLRNAPGHDAKSSRSNGSIWSETALAGALPVRMGPYGPIMHWVMNSLPALRLTPNSVFGGSPDLTSEPTNVAEVPTENLGDYGLIPSFDSSASISGWSLRAASISA